jgi:hypothetical protein
MYPMYKGLFFLPLLCSVTLAGSEPKITKLVIRYIASDLPNNTAGAKPKTFCVASNRYARIEQESDAALHSPNLIIVNEPDIWVIDLATKSGTHSVNAGPDLSVHNPILGTDSPEELFDFEFGYELQFLNRVHAKNLGSKEIRGTQCITREFEASDYLVTMYLDSKKNSPVELKVFKNGTMMFRIEYLNYENGLPFDASLFEPPIGISFTEQSQ